MAKTFLRLSFIGALVGLLLAFGIINISATECGTTDFTRRLISKGTATDRGEFPFLAAVYSVKQLEFICGGSLISAKHVLTAAHCTNGYGIISRPADVIVFLGAYDLTSRNETGVVQRNVIDIHYHPDWYAYSEKYDADVAILVLSEIVLFTHYIRPVCMPPDDSVVAGVNGTIIGWGLTESGTQSHLQYPKQGVTNALNDSYCYTTDYIIAKISSLRTFCGSGGFSSPNKGDSGGGFFVRYGSAWVQFGIVSAIRSNATGFVDPNSISVYSIVKEFKTWINDTVRQSGGEVGEAIGMKKIQIQLDCNYEYVNIDGSYGCFLNYFDIRRDNFEVGSFAGSHQNGKSDKDVELLQFRKGTMFYLPDGIGNNFQNLKRVKIGGLSNLNTKLISRSNLKNLKGVVDLYIFENDIETFEEDTLWDLPKLEIFELTKNKLNEIQENTFLNNPKLTEVWLQSNQLEFIPANLFRRNLLLEKVSLWRNNLKTIDEETFINNSKLREVRLYSNQLKSIPSNLFEKNFLLERIDLHDNSLKTIESTLFVNNSNLKEINLYANQLESIPGNLFRQNFLLQTVRLNENNLKAIDDLTFANNSKLRVVALSENKFESIPGNLFQQNILLETVWLGGNNLKTIDEMTFVGNPKLKILNLEKNQLELLPANLFRNNLLLEEIDFIFNSIKRIDVDFTVFNNVKNIFLYHNLCIDGYYEGTEDPTVYRNQFRNLTEFLNIIRANCSSAKP